MYNLCTLHGVFLEIYGYGILLTGHSGCGKSECALQLIDRGHRLIADDAPNFCLDEHQKVIGYCPAPLQNLLEVRGLGIIDVHLLYGPQAVCTLHPLDLIIHLTEINSDPEFTERRLQPKLEETLILGSPIPQITLFLALSKNVAILIETTVKLAFTQKSPMIKQLLTLSELNQ